MASGIAEVFAKAGYDVVLAARSEEKAQAAKARIGKSLSRSVDKGRMTAEAAAETLDRITPAGSYDAFADIDLALEAVAEDLDVKRQLFATFDKVCKPGAILATTTSSLPVVACARATSRPQDVIGMHFFNPAPAMKLVEVVRTVLTADEVHATVRELCTTVRKHPVDCGDRAGFIVNALLFPYLNNAIKMVQEHYASLDEIDTAMKLGGGYPMGPFELLDVVGLDVSLAIERSCTASSATRAWLRHRCWSTWWPRAASAARPAAASANMPSAELPGGRSGDGSGNGSGNGGGDGGGARRARRIRASSCGDAVRSDHVPARQVLTYTSRARHSGKRRGRSRRRPTAQDAPGTGGRGHGTVRDQGVRGDHRRRDRGGGRSRPPHLLPSLPVQGRGDLPRPRRHPGARRGGAQRGTRARAPARHRVPRHQGSHEDVRGPPEVSVQRYRLTREVPTLREAEIASVARYERLFTRYLLGHFDEHAHDDDAQRRPAARGGRRIRGGHRAQPRAAALAAGRRREGDVEAQLDHAFAIVRKTFGTGIGAGRESAARPATAASAAAAGRGAGDGGPDGRTARRGHAARSSRPCGNGHSRQDLAPSGRTSTHHSARARVPGVGPLSATQPPQRQP